jgi:hypothetical protein
MVNGLDRFKEHFAGYAEHHQRPQRIANVV